MKDYGENKDYNVSDAESEQSGFNPPGETELTSASARILAATGGSGSDPEDDVPVNGGFFANFWYHYKWTVIIVSFFAVVILVGVLQMTNKEKEDVSIMYAGPEYISSDSNESFREAVKMVMSDYNGDGKKGVMFAALTCMTNEQVDARYKAAVESGISDYYIDRSSNAEELKKFRLNVFSGEYVILLLDPEMYSIAQEGAELIPLAEIFDSLPECAADEYSIKLSKTEFYEFFDGIQKMPDDTVMCVRRVSSMIAYRKSKKADEIQQCNLEMFRDIVNFSVQ